ncbi:TIGR03620 family F420-dependent LLM class oxidoreductase [Actinocorallia sp. API 0066]|uniref:TIGR03620 family F420-dependent LLM class oxidoreductase n=1 Tax=Actinocorallia sp. API 0066 TaxID=2896846 RepID=UPI001E4F255D|nr:TIGR03620 family F420-dependent LLM class oxidoreductase [Actinocorallia sp. API 0066]MCD0449181.1 TIGR03620 family F420-dependent LLM class oxidoreductase [Actinocorallia sp. API 0066]
MWSRELRYGDVGEGAEAAAELEELGFTALWVPDTGGRLFGAVENLLGATARVVVATGILNLWMHEAGGAAAAHASLTATYGDRFLMGIGVSHAPIVDRKEAGRYRRPLAAMEAFLDGLDAAPVPVPVESRVLAALGPKMLELAGRRAHGVHPYLVTPEHTRIVREALGPGALVLPEQSVILTESADEARALGTAWLKTYLALPNYTNNLLRLGFTREDVDSVSDRLFNALISWGDVPAVAARVAEHRAAGADHVAVQVIIAEPKSFPREEWRRLAAALV